MNAIEVFRASFKTNHDFLEGTVADVADADANARAPGVANPIGANYGHAILGEDALINMAVRGGAPLFASTHAGKSGFSEAPPPGPDWHDWALRVKADMTQARAFAQVVYGATDAYLASIKDSDLDRVLDLKAINVPSMPLGAFLTIICSNAAWHTGEIASLKGQQGKKGYPM